MKFPSLTPLVWRTIFKHLPVAVSFDGLFLYGKEQWTAIPYSSCFPAKIFKKYQINTHQQNNSMKLT